MSRLPVVDALRGFALFGILVVNLQYFAFPLGADLAQFDKTPLDAAATWLTRALFESKFYVLFSFLFGYGFHIQLERDASAPARQRARYWRRILGLFVLGALHGVFLFAGDILVSYAILGLGLWFVRGWEDDRIERGAVGALGVACLLGALIGVSFAFGASEQDAEMQAEVQQSIAAFSGTAAQAIAQRLKDLQLLYAFAPFFTWPTAFAMFLLGLLAGRSAFFTRLENLDVLIRGRWVQALVLAVAANALYATCAYGTGQPLLSALAFGSLPLAGPLLALLYARGVWRYVASHPDAVLSRALQAAGRLSLTNYLAQALICSWIFNGWGLGLYARVSPAALLPLAIGIYGAQLFASHLWLRYVSIGPMEFVLRAFTRLQRPQ